MKHAHPARKTRSRVALFLIAAATIVAAFTPYPVIGLIASTLLWAVLAPVPSAANTILFRLVFGFLVTACFQQIAGVFFWLANVPFTPVWVITLQTTLAVAFTLVTSFKFSPKKLTDIVRFSRSDAIAGGIALLSSGFILIGIFHGGSTQQQLLRYLTTGFDNTLHLSLVSTNYDAQGYVFGPADEIQDRIVYPDLVSYPQGWHLSTSIWVRSIIPTGSLQDDLVKFMFLYTLFQLIWYALTVYLFAKAITSILSYFQRDGQLGPLLVVLSSTILFQIAILFGALRIGFSSFIPIFVYCLFLLILAVLVKKDIDEKKASTPWSLHYYFVLACIVACAISLTWLLGAPMGYAFALLVPFALLAKIDRIPYRKVLKSLLVNPFSLLALMLLVALPFFQFYLQIAYGVKNNQINETGGIEPLNNLLFLSALIISVWIYCVGTFKRLSSLFISFIFMPLLLAGLIYLYQYYSAQTINYYSIKTAFIPWMLLLVFTAGALAYYSSELQRHIGLFFMSVLVVSVTVSLPQVMNIDASTLSFITGRYRNMSPYSSSQIVDAQLKQGDTAKFVILKELNYEEDLIVSNFMKMLTRKNTECERVIIVSLLFQQRTELLDNIDRCASMDRHHTFNIVTSSKNYDEIKSRFSGTKNINVILSN